MIDEEMRAALVRRHFALMEEEQAIGYYWLVRAFDAAPAINAMLASMGRVTMPEPVPASVIAPEPEPVAPAPPVPQPWAIRPRTPDGLRERLGLR